VDDAALGTDYRLYFVVNAAAGYPTKW